MISTDMIQGRLTWAKHGDWNQGEWRFEVLHVGFGGLIDISWVTLRLDRLLMDDMEQINDQQ